MTQTYKLGLLVLLLLVGVPFLAGAVTVTTDADSYVVGESIIMYLENITPNSSLTIYGPQDIFKWDGQLSSPLTFYPQLQGIYSIVVSDKTTSVDSLNITVFTDLSQSSVVSTRPVPKTETLVSLDELDPMFFEEEIPDNALSFAEKESVKERMREKIKLFDRERSELSVGIDVKEKGEEGYDVEFSLPLRHAKKAELRNLVVDNSTTAIMGVSELILTEIRDTGRRGKWDVIYPVQFNSTEFTDGSVHIIASGSQVWSCSQWNIEATSCGVEWVFEKTVQPGQEYTIPITRDVRAYAELGVATVNTIKPIYKPNEVVDLAMIVLDQFGYVETDANLILTITNPVGYTGLFSTVGGGIETNSSGAYVAQFGDTERAGTYSLQVDAQGEHVASTLYSQFVVQEDYPFEIRRTTPLVIDPYYAPFRSSLHITSYVDATISSVREKVPNSFKIEEEPGLLVYQTDEYQIIEWVNVSNNSVLSYKFSTPTLSPQIYQFQSEIEYVTATFSGLFEEARPWYVAVDPPPADAIITYRDTDANNLRYRVWNGTSNNLGVEQSGPNFGDALLQNEIECMEEQQQCIYLAGLTGGDIVFAIYYAENNSWGKAQTIGAGNAQYHNFDVACEDTSGDCLIVYETTTTNDQEFDYRIYYANGTLSSALGPVTVSPSPSADFNWMYLYPQYGTEVIGMTIKQGTPASYGGIWNGSSFGNWQELWNDDPQAARKSTSCAWEGVSGHLNCFFGRDTTTGIWGYEWNGSQWNDLGEVWPGTDLGAEARQIVTCGEDPYTGDLSHDKLLVLSGDASNDRQGAVWNGTALRLDIDPAEDTSSEVQRVDNAACMWEHGGATAIVAWVDLNQLEPEWGTFTESTNSFDFSNWGAGDTSGMVTLNDDVESLNMAINPFNDQMLMVTAGYTNGAVNPAYAGCTRWTGSAFDATNCGVYETTVTTDTGGAREFLKYSAVDWFRFNDVIPPNLTLHHPANNTVNTSISFMFNWTPDDDKDKTLSCNLTIDGVVNITNIASPRDTSTTQTVSGFTSGDHSWRVSCWDDFENIVTSETWVFAVDGPVTITIENVEQDLTETYTFSNQTPTVNAIVNMNASCYLSEFDESYADMVTNGRENCGFYERHVPKLCTYTTPLSIGNDNLYMACNTSFGSENSNTNNEDMNLFVLCDTHLDCADNNFCNFNGQCQVDQVYGFDCALVNFDGLPADETCGGIGSNSLCINDTTYNYTGWYCTQDANDCVYNNTGNSFDANYALCDVMWGDAAYKLCGESTTNEWGSVVSCEVQNTGADQTATASTHPGGNCSYYASDQTCSSGDLDLGSYGCVGTPTYCGPYIYNEAGSCGSDLSACDVGCGATCDVDNSTTPEIIGSTCYFDRSCNNACNWFQTNEEAPDFCINDWNGGTCTYTTRTNPNTTETCYYGTVCQDTIGANLSSSGTLRVDYCDYCSAAGEQTGAFSPTPNESCSSNCSNSGTIYYDTGLTPLDRSDDCSIGVTTIATDTLSSGDIWNGSAAPYCENTECNLDCGTLTGTCQAGACVCNDTDNPVINIIYPQDGDWDNDGFVLFYFNVSDYGSGIENCTLLVNNMSVNTTINPVEDITLNISTYLATNQYNWSITCFDNSTQYRQTTTIERELGIDPYAPSMKNSLTSGTAFDINDNICLEVHVDDYAENWWNTSWNYRKEITITSQINQTLTNYPVYLNVTAESGMQIDYDDLRFFNDSCDATTLSALDYEIEYYDGAHADIFVEIPSFTTGINTICMYYGNDSVTTTENVNAVWNSNFGIVYHMDASGIDSTANGRDRVADIGSPSTDNSFIGYGMYFDGTTAWDMADLESDGGYWEEEWYDRTHEILFETSADVSSRQTLFAEGGGTNGIMMYIYNGDLYARWWSESQSWPGDYISTSVDANSLVHAVMVYNTSGNYSFIVNGEVIDSRSASAFMNAHVGDGGIAYTGTSAKDYHDSSTAGNYFNGTMYELRVMDNEESSQWFYQNYYNFLEYETTVTQGTEVPIELTNQLASSGIEHVYATIDRPGLSNINISLLDNETTTCDSVNGNNIYSIDYPLIFSGNYQWIKAFGIDVAGNIVELDLSYSWWVDAGGQLNISMDAPLVSFVLNESDTQQNYSYQQTCTAQCVGTDADCEDVKLYAEYKPTTIFSEITTGTIDIINNESSYFCGNLSKAPWWNQSWSNRKEINITNVGATNLTDFPTFLNITFSSGMQSDYDDLRFLLGTCGANTLQLDYDLVNYDVNSAMVYVSIPNLAVGETSLCMYYNNSGVSNAESPATVWSGYAAVWHFEENGTVDRTDATGNGYEGAPQQFDNDEDIVGRIGRADTFDGTTDYIAIRDLSYYGLAIPEMTTCTWFNTAFSGAAYNDNWAFLDFDRSEFFNFYIRGDNGGIGFSTMSGSIHDHTSTATGFNDGNWHYACAVYDGTDKMTYIDGVLSGTSSNAHSGGVLGQTSNTRFGFIGDGSEAPSFNGSRNNIWYQGAIDELVYIESTQSANWINQSYQMVQNPTSFVTIGIAEDVTDIDTSASMCSFTFEITTGQNAGNNTFPLRCKVSSGNSPTEFSTQTNITVNDHPTPLWYYPVASQWLYQTEILHANLTYDDTNISLYTFTYDNTSSFASPDTICSTNDTNCTWNTLTQVQCLNNSLSCYVRVTAEDEYGLTNYTQLLIGFDTAGPLSVLDQPINNSTITGNAVTLNASIVDNEIGTIDVVQFQFRPNSSAPFVNACQDTDGTMPFECVWDTSVELDSLTYEVRVRANDTFGNLGDWNAHIGIILDRSPPLILLVNPPDATYYKENVTLYYNVTDQGSSISSCTLMLNSSSNATEYVIVEGQTHNFSLSLLPEGDYNWSVNCTDGNGFVNSSLFRIFSIDATGPVLTLDQPATSVAIDGSSYEVNATVTDAGIGIIDTVFFDYRPNTSTSFINFCNNTDGIVPYNCSWDIGTLADGIAYEIRARANDSLGNIGSYDTHTSITIDNQPPIIDLLGPANNSIDADENVTLEFNASDIGSSLTNCSVYLNGTLNTTFTSPTEGLTYSVDLTVLDNGDYNWSVTCFDTHTTPRVAYSQTWWFKVDVRYILQAFTYTDAFTYQQGNQQNETINITSNTTDIYNGSKSADITVDFIIGNTSVPWWNTNWEQRIPLLFTNDLPMNRTDAPVTVNVTGLDSNISTCANEIRVVDAELLEEVPFNIVGGDDDTFCTVRFFSNTTASATDIVRYHMYYNNSGATDPGYATINTQYQIMFENFNDSTGGGGWVTSTTTCGATDFCSASSPWGEFTDCTDINDYEVCTTDDGSNLEHDSADYAFLFQDSDNYNESLGLLYNFSMDTACGGSVCDQIKLEFDFHAASLDTDEFCTVWMNDQDSKEVQILYCLDGNTSCEYDNDGTPEPGDYLTIGPVDLCTYAGIDCATSQTELFIGGYVNGNGDYCHYDDFNITGTRTNTDNLTITIESPETWTYRETNTTSVAGIYKFYTDASGYQQTMYSAVTWATRTQYTDAYGGTLFSVVDDFTPPTINLVVPTNNTESNSSVTFAYTVNDVLSTIANCSLLIDGVVTDTRYFIQEGPAQFFFPRIPSGGPHNWSVACMDAFGNEGVSEEWIVIIVPPDLSSSWQNITFSDYSPIEEQNVTIFATIFNTGGSDAENVTVQFFVNDPAINGVQIGENITISNISDINGNYSNVTINISYILTDPGPYNIFMAIDPPTSTNGTILESNESNNKYNRTLVVSGYQVFIGNITRDIVLQSLNNDTFVGFFNVSITTGNIFFIDDDSDISFNDLVPIGRTVFDGPILNDFGEVDGLLNMSGFSDSINQQWTGGTGIPDDLGTLQIYGTNITNIALINSTNTSSFKTGILWDSSDDDSFNTEFDAVDQEDLVFVTAVNMSETGAYGIYDYEAKIPVRLREYKGGTQTIGIYYELQ